MAIKTQRWGPDTCGCIFEETWDTDVAPVNRVHTFVNRVKDDPAHAALTGLEAYNTVRDENRRKNITFKIALGIEAALKTLNYTWLFDANRVLEVQFVDINIPPPIKTFIQDACDLQFGPNKVRIL